MLALYGMSRLGYTAEARQYRADIRPLSDALSLSYMLPPLTAAHALTIQLFAPQVKKQGRLKQILFHAAIAYKHFWMRMGFTTDKASPLANRLVFKNTQVRC